jgi:hypothetical protein
MWRIIIILTLLVCIVVGATTLVLFTIEQASSAESYGITLMPTVKEDECTSLKKRMRRAEMRLANLQDNETLSEDELIAIEHLKEDIKRCQDRLRVIDPDFKEQEQSEYLKEGGKDRLDEGVEIDPLMVRVCFITSVVMVCVFVLSKQIK